MTWPLCGWAGPTASPERGSVGLDNNSDSFDTFFRRCLPRLVTFLITLGVAREEAQDAAAEAMVRAYVAWGTVRQPEAWVRVVAQRLAVNDLARRREGGPSSCGRGLARRQLFRR